MWHMKHSFQRIWWMLDPGYTASTDQPMFKFVPLPLHSMVYRQLFVSHAICPKKNQEATFVAGQGHEPLATWLAWKPILGTSAIIVHQITMTNHSWTSSTPSVTICFKQWFVANICVHMFPKKTKHCGMGTPSISKPFPICGGMNFDPHQSSKVPRPARGRSKKRAGAGGDPAGWYRCWKWQMIISITEWLEVNKYIG